jgi:hypothetical protein
MVMTDIDALLEKARSKAKGYGEKYGAFATADDHLKTTYAILYEDVPSEYKTAPERDSWVKRQPEYMVAVERKRDAYAEWKAAESFFKLLLTEAEVWRTKCANDRDMDKAHR